MDFGIGLAVAAALAALIMTGGIVDVLRLGRDRFAAVGKRRWQWVLLILYSGPLGVLLYAAAVRPQVVHPERYTDDPADARGRWPSPEASRAHESAARQHSGAAVAGRP